MFNLLLAPHTIDYAIFGACLEHTHTRARTHAHIRTHAGTHTYWKCYSWLSPTYVCSFILLQCIDYSLQIFDSRF